MKEGEDCGEIQIIVSGQCKVIKKIKLTNELGKEEYEATEIVTFGRGEIIGVSSLMEEPNPYSVLVLSETCRLYSISCQEFRTKYKRSFEHMEQFYRDKQ